ncbi:hypothetical protein GGU10DRAFT_353773 [Lentinula aff. detonsa]|uniref:NAD(P)-binding protein n=1 Tax=Lentinula aff. detonsa TaxID=2804958 RepID=A0AA38KSH1_9AGAR|nr:hypothetical protein GGU10DRAFT_353773 [Lentinula aff. detonsa]
MAPRFNPKRDLVDLHGRVIIVTGANRPLGLGYSTVKHLASAGAKVYIAARNEQQSLQSIEKLKADLHLDPSDGNSGQVHFLKLDLGDPRDVKKVAEEFLAKESRLDVLVNNAAMVFAPFEKTSDGISKIVVTNLISPFVFTQTLLPLMAKTAQEENSDIRIVNVSSITHYIANIKKLENVEDLNQEYRRRPLAKFTRYAHTKLLIIIWTRALHRYLSSLSSTMPGMERITAMALDPGNIDTFSNRWPLPWLWRPFVRLLMTAPNVDVGAYPTVFAAAGKAIYKDRGKYAGRYLNEKMNVVNPSSDARSDKLAEELWTLVEKTTNDMGL